MGLGILKDRYYEKEDDVPGTTLLYTPGTTSVDVLRQSNISNDAATRSLKTTNGIILSPQPLDDPNDPLV